MLLTLFLIGQEQQRRMPSMYSLSGHLKIYMHASLASKVSLRPVASLMASTDFREMCHQTFTSSDKIGQADIPVETRDDGSM